MAPQFHTPPGWPPAPTGWIPDSSWRPDPSWPPAPAGWVFWTDAPQVPQLVWAPPSPAPAAAQIPRASASRSSWVTRLAWLPTLAFGTITYLIVMRVMLATQNPNLFPTLLFIGAITVPASVLMLAYGLGHRVGHDGVLVVVTAVVGGIIGVIAAGALESTIQVGTQETEMIAVAVIEEAVKMIAPLAIFLVLRRRTPSLGVILGIASGAGFAVLETMGYGFTVLLATSGNVAVVDQTLMWRALLSPASHVAWTGIVAAALWRTADPRRTLRAPLLIGAFLAAVALHATWDSTDATSVQVSVMVISLVLLIVAVIDSVRAPREQPLAPPVVWAPVPPIGAGLPGSWPSMTPTNTAVPVPAEWRAESAEGLVHRTPRLPDGGPHSF